MSKAVKKGARRGAVSGDARRATEADRIIGANIRARRLATRMSQDKLAEAIGVTFQQIQKYESGSNRVAAGVLLNIARALGVPIDALLPKLKHGDSPNEGPPPVQDAQSLAMLTAFGRIRSAATKRMIVKLTEIVANADAADAESPDED
ncbi:MAG: helix-turn-helix domain-containing protein [Hyphomonadaceae bacterium]